jgi:hypothetical protein
MSLVVGGDDLLRELTYRQVGNLVIDDGAGGADTSGPADIIALAPSGWTLDTVNGYNATAKSVLHQFEGESVLAAFARLAEMTGENFRLGAGRKVVWMKNDAPASGIRAFQGGDAVALANNEKICLILDLEETRDTYELVTRVYPYGSGEGDARVTLTGSTHTKTGYTINTSSNYIKRDAAETAYGQIERYMSWKDIDDPDTLLEMAYEYLAVNSYIQKSYRMTVAKLEEIVYPGETMVVVYHRWVDGYHAVNVSNASLVVLESTTRIDEGGLRTVGMQIGTADREGLNQAEAILKPLNEARNFLSHPQAIAGGDVSGMAPDSATYVVTELHAQLTNEVVFNLNGIVRLATVSGVSLNTTSKTTLYTVPSGKSAIIAHVVIRVASTSLTTAQFGFGFNANADDVIAAALHAELTSSTLYKLLDPKAGAAIGAATNVFGIKATVTQSATITVDVWGYLY